MTPLHFASIVAFTIGSRTTLLEHGADPRIPNIHNRTPADYYTESCQLYAEAISMVERGETLPAVSPFLTREEV